MGGMVDSVDGPTATIHISVPGMGAKREVAVQTAKNTVVRRYAADSARPENAKTATIAEIRAGDQLRARGNRNADGSKLDAEEIYVGFFPAIFRHCQIRRCELGNTHVAGSLQQENCRSEGHARVPYAQDSDGGGPGFRHETENYGASGARRRLQYSR